jgi:hypothetical protein
MAWEFVRQGNEQRRERDPGERRMTVLRKTKREQDARRRR